jgi:hypothetical protein
MELGDTVELDGRRDQRWTLAADQEATGTVDRPTPIGVEPIGLMNERTTSRDEAIEDQIPYAIVVHEDVVTIMSPGASRSRPHPAGTQPLR